MLENLPSELVDSPPNKKYLEQFQATSNEQIKKTVVLKDSATVCEIKIKKKKWIEPKYKQLQKIKEWPFIAVTQFVVSEGSGIFYYLDGCYAGAIFSDKQIIICDPITKFDFK